MEKVRFTSCATLTGVKKKKYAQQADLCIPTIYYSSAESGLTLMPLSLLNLGETILSLKPIVIIYGGFQDL